MGRVKSTFRSYIIPTMILGFMLTIHTNAIGQDKAGKPDATSRDIEKKKWERQREVNKATKKVLKAHMKHQTKEVRKRMRKDAKKAEKNNGEG